MGYSQSKEIHRRIMRESYRLFVKEGYKNVTTRGIAEKCDLTRSNLHYYYNKKEFILLDILQTINKELKLYFYSQFPVWEMGMAFVIYYLYLSFGASDHLCALQMLSWELFADTELMQEFVKTGPHFSRKQSEGFNHMDDKDIAIFVFYGTLSQLAQLRVNGDSDQSMREIINTAAQAFFLYLGYTAESIEKMLQTLNGYDVSGSVDQFIAHYEDKFGWR